MGNLCSKLGGGGGGGEMKGKGDGWMDRLISPLRAKWSHLTISRTNAHLFKSTVRERSR